MYSCILSWYFALPKARRHGRLVTPDTLLH